MKKYTRIVKFVLSIAMATVVGLPAVAQEGWEEGQLEAVEIEIVKERQITLPKANRKYDKVPPQQTTSPIKAPVEYNFKPFSFQTPLINPTLRPLRIREPEPERVFNGQVSAGYGNYASPYFEGFINTGRDKNLLAGARAFYHASGEGPVDAENSASGNAGVSLFGKTFTRHISASGELGFQNRFAHFYGYPVGAVAEGDAIRQSYNTFSASLAVTNTMNTALSYDLGFGFSHLADRFDARETEVTLDFGSAYAINETSSLRSTAEYSLLNRKDAPVEATPRSLLSANAAYVFFPAENLQMSAGIAVAYETDSLDAKDLHVYPDINIRYPLSPSVDVVALLTGGIEKVSLHRLAGENIWLEANVPLFHTNKRYDFQVGLNTRVGNKIAVNGGISFAALENWYFYVNSFDDPSKFTTEYDTDVATRTNFFASFGFVQQKAAKFLLRGDLYAYSRDSGEAVWHRPAYKVTADISFNVRDKLLFDINMIAQGGMKAKGYTAPPVSETVIDLDPALDLNARMEYGVSETFSVFAQANNILDNEYPIYLAYPVRGFQVLGGATIRF